METIQSCGATVRTLERAHLKIWFRTIQHEEALVAFSANKGNTV